MWIANSQKCLEEESSSREYLCYLFSPGVCFLMFAEETWIPFCRQSLNVYICYQWFLCPLIPGAFREDVARASTGNPTEWQNDESEMSMGFLFMVFIVEFHSKKQRGSWLHLGQREREMSGMKNPSSLWAECRKIIEKISETFKNHGHSKVFFK